MILRFLSPAAVCILLFGPLAGPALLAQEAELRPAQNLKELSIEELTQIDVTSVSRRAEPVSRTAAAVSVVRGEDVRRSGTVVLAEALRLADAVDVARVGGSTWGISTRGFNISTANKLLVLVDGRSTYSGLFGGTFWDVQDMLLPDLDRIEVIRGPGGTIWGANAVNGLINIISKPAAATQGTTVTLIGGLNERAVVSARYGSELGRGHFRVYGKYRVRAAQERPDGAGAGDDLTYGQGGFWIDSDQAGASTWSLSGAAYRGGSGNPGRGDTDVSGGHLLGRWTRRTGPDETLTIQAYYDRSYRNVPLQFEGTKNVAELDVQQRLDRGRHLLIVGGTGRVSRATDIGRGTLLFDPHVRNGWTATAFAQDEITLVRNRAYVIAGAQFGGNNFTGIEFQPTARVRFHPDARQMLWAAASKAVRLPTRFDTDLRLLTATGAVRVRGSDDFEPESVVAYEGGYRVVPHTRLSLDLAVFHNRYDRLRSQEAGLEEPPVVVLRNGLNGRTRGVEVAATIQPARLWRVHGSYAWLGKSLTLDSGSRDASGGVSEGNDPSHLATARSYFDLPHDLAFDAMFRFVGRRPAPVADAYAELDLRLGWMARPGWELSLVGQNLLRARHAELFSPANPTTFPRSFFVRSIWTF